MDAYGRKQTMILSTPLFVTGCLFMGFAQTIELVYIGRLFTGIATGFLYSTCAVSATIVTTAEYHTSTQLKCTFLFPRGDRK